jgi:predicted AlkP superfamily pyrophosphatase or phosphodiesterase
MNMRRYRALLIVFFFLNLASPGQERRTTPYDASAALQHVVVISIDGLMPEVYLHPDAHGLRTPTFRSMMENGAYSRGIQPIFPGVTYPSHASIATGCNPGTHGIVTNRAWDPLDRNAGGLRWYAEDVKIPTIWELLRSHHLRVSLIGWPVTVGAASDLLLPDFWRANTAEDVKLLRSVSTPGLLDAVDHQFPGFYARYLDPETRDEALTDAAIYSIYTQKPALVMLHLVKVVYKEHIYGPFSPEAIAATEDADRQVSRLIKALEKTGISGHSVVMVVSDYGFTRNSTNIHPGVLLAQAGLITLDSHHHAKAWKAIVMPMDGTTYVYVKDQNDKETQQKLLELFQPLAGKPGSGVSRVITSGEIVKMGGDPKAFLAVEAENGFSMEPGYEGAYAEPADMAGSHGMFPDRPESYGALLVTGSLVKKGEIAGARLIDLAPTLANWFGLRMYTAEGATLPILRQRDLSRTARDHGIQ